MLRSVRYSTCTRTRDPFRPLLSLSCYPRQPHADLHDLRSSASRGRAERMEDAAWVGLRRRQGRHLPSSSIEREDGCARRKYLPRVRDDDDPFGVVHGLSWLWDEWRMFLRVEAENRALFRAAGSRRVSCQKEECPILCN